MSTEYSDRKTREILGKVNGQAKLAEQAMQTLAQRDPAFLLSLVEPYLGGIIAHAIERARKSAPSARQPAAPLMGAMKKVAPKEAAKARPVSTSAMNNLAEALARNFEKNAKTAPEKAQGAKVSKSHLEAMQALVKKKF